MPDMLIRDVDGSVLSALDVQAAAAGLSRSEYVRRLLVQQASQSATVTMDDLRRLADTFADARDPEVMDAMWR